MFQHKKQTLHLFKIIFFVITGISGLTTKAQEIVPPYTAKAYWIEQNNPNYQLLKIKLNKGDSLTSAEKEWLNDYNSYLTTYFEKLSDLEKEKYHIYKELWNEEERIKEKQKTVIPREEREEKFKTNEVLFLRHLGQSGVFGFYYGLAGVAILELYDGGAVIGIPLLAAGGSMLIPILKCIKG